MPTIYSQLNLPRSLFLIGVVLILSTTFARADQTKANNNTTLDQSGSWVSGVAPAGLDNAIWDSTVATPANCTNTLAAAATWKSIVINNPSAPVVINGNTTLTLSNGLSVNNASLTVNCGTINLGANQTWNVASGLTLITGSATTSGAVNSPNNGNFIVTKSGSGVWTTSGTGDNGSSGIIINGGTVNLNKAVNSAHSVGGPGLTINNGGTARITGSGGDQIYDGATVTLANGGTLDLDGNSETIGALSGSSGIVDNTAAGKAVTLTLGSTGSTFGGTIQNSGSGATLALNKTGSGTLVLNGTNTYSGGTTVSAGTLSLTTTANSTMAYTLSGGTLSVTPSGTTASLPMNSLTLGGGSQLTFNFGSVRNLNSPLITNSGVLSISGNIAVNVQNVVQSGTCVLLQYSGTRSGSGSFVAGTLPGGATITDDTVNQRLTLTYASLLEPTVIIPSLNTNEVIVAITTPQQYGAVGDGITDDSAAFQRAMNAVYNSGGFGGGVVYVPAANYAFYTNITIPTGVTLHGNWTDWTKTGGGLTGTTFKVYFGAGQSNATPFITMSGSTALRGVNIWYPNQNPNAITAYPFSIAVGDDSAIQNVALVNSYQGIASSSGGSDKHILSTIVGTPLYLGIALNQIFDVCHAEDIRFSPDVWAASGVSNAPTIGGAYAAWMRANGEGMRLLRVDGEMCMDTFINGYHVGIEANAETNGQPGCTFYSGVVSNCATAFLAQDMPTAFGPMFANFTLDGDIAIDRTNSADDANAQFTHCQIIGRSGIAVSSIGADWHSWMQFQNCTISNALQLTGPGVFNVVDSTLLGSTQCVLAANATRAAFTGCTFSPAMNLVNNGNVSNLLVDARQSVSNAFPIVYWTNVMNNYLSRQPAETNLSVVTDSQWGAFGDGVHDDTVAIQNALNAAGINGGGIVYLPAGWYHLTNTLDVPDGVELRGAFEKRHGTSSGADGIAKGTILQPYGGQGTTNGPPAIALEANAGLLGVTISYQTQNTNCIPFPPAIQGRGANVYAIGVCCPNPYYYLDLDTYTCTNHFIDMADGWALKTGYVVGHGSSGTIVDCHCNWTYWIENGDGQSTLPPSIQAPVLSFTSHYLKMYVLGDCTEQMIKDFSIIENNYVDCIAENGKGPNVTLINNYCDATIQGFILDSAAPTTLNAVNTPMTTFNFGDYPDQAQSTVAVLSTTNFQGTARFFSSVLWGGTYLDFVVNGGDVGFDMAHMDTHSFIGSLCNGGAFHLINNSAYISYNGISNFPPYNVTFSAGSGITGITNEFLGNFAYNGCSLINFSTNSSVNTWNDYALSSYSVLNPNLPVIYGVSPNGSSLFQYTNALNFSAISPAGIATSNIIVTINGVNVTNLIFTGSATGWNVSYAGLTFNGFYTITITVKDNAGNIVSSGGSFDTFNPSTYTFEAEDFDYTSNGVSGLFIDNPQTDAYFNLGSVGGIDFSNSILGQGTATYRPQGLETEGGGDLVRPAYASGQIDYDIGFNNGGTGNWGNYTRTYPAGIYNIYMRAASPNGSPLTTDSASLSVVTSGRGTLNQAVTKLGTFSVPNSGGWQTYTWVPLKDVHGNYLQITNNGTIKTLRATTDNGGYNVNFYALVPAGNIFDFTASVSSSSVQLLFPTQTGLTYQVQYKNNLTDASWTVLSTSVTGNGLMQTISDPASGNGRFYRVFVQ